MLLSNLVLSLIGFCGAMPFLTSVTDTILNKLRRFDEMALQTQLAALEPCTSDPDSTVHDPGDGDPPPGPQPRLTT